MSLVDLVAQLASCDRSAVGGVANLIADQLRTEHNRSIVDGPEVTSIIQERFEEDPTAFARLLANVLVDNDLHRQLTIDCGLSEQILSHLDDSRSKQNLTILAALLNLTTDYAPAQSHLTWLIPRLAGLLNSFYNDRSSELSPKIIDYAFDTLSNLLHVASLPSFAHAPLLEILSRFLTDYHLPEFVQQLSVVLQETALKSPELKRSFVEYPKLLDTSLEFLERYEAGDADDAADITVIKSNLIKIIVDLPNEDSLLPLLLSSSASPVSDESKVENGVIVRMVDWIRHSARKGRADLVICAAHYLAALARNDATSIMLVADYDVLPPLCELLKDQIDQYFVPVPPSTATPVNGSNSSPVEESATDGTAESRVEPSKRSDKGEIIQLLYGVVNLLRHLAIPRANKSLLANADLMEPLSRLLGTSLDFVGPLQVSVVGLLKLIVGDTDSGVTFVLGPEESPSTPLTPSPTPLDVMIALISRTDEVRIQAEGTRVSINAIKSLFTARTLATTSPEAASPRLRAAQEIVRSIEVVEILVRLIRTQEKFPVLVNEAVAALILLVATMTASRTSEEVDGESINVGGVIDLLVFAPPAPVVGGEEAELEQEAKLLEITDEEPEESVVDTTNSSVGAGSTGEKEGSSVGGSAMAVFVRWLESLPASHASTSSSTTRTPASANGNVNASPPKPKIEKEMVKNVLILLLALVNALDKSSPSSADAESDESTRNVADSRRKILLDSLRTPLSDIVEDSAVGESEREYAVQILKGLVWT